MTKYVFGPDRTDGVLIHQADCGYLSDTRNPRECPDAVVDLVRFQIHAGVPYPDRRVGICDTCWGAGDGMSVARRAGSPVCQGF